MSHFKIQGEPSLPTHTLESYVVCCLEKVVLCRMVRGGSRVLNHHKSFCC